MLIGVVDSAHLSQISQKGFERDSNPRCEWISLFTSAVMLNHCDFYVTPPTPIFGRLFPHVMQLRLTFAGLHHVNANRGEKQDIAIGKLIKCSSKVHAKLARSHSDVRFKRSSCVSGVASVSDSKRIRKGIWRRISH